jgi:hypothetical protein
MHIQKHQSFHSVLKLAFQLKNQLLCFPCPGGRLHRSGGTKWLRQTYPHLMLVWRVTKQKSNAEAKLLAESQRKNTRDALPPTPSYAPVFLRPNPQTWASKLNCLNSNVTCVMDQMFVSTQIHELNLISSVTSLRVKASLWEVSVLMPFFKRPES